MAVTDASADVKTALDDLKTGMAMLTTDVSGLSIDLSLRSSQVQRIEVAVTHGLNRMSARLDELVKQLVREESTDVTPQSTQDTSAR